MTIEVTDPNSKIPPCAACGKRYTTMIARWRKTWCERCIIEGKDLTAAHGCAYP